jgi:hypothetical protein
VTAEIFQIRFQRPAAHFELDPATGHPALYQSAQMGDQIHVRCPHCHILAPQRGPDKNYHCYISLTLEVYRCMRCGDSGSLRFLLRQKTEEDILQHRQLSKTLYNRNHKFPGAQSLRATPNHFRTAARTQWATSFRFSPGRTIPLKALPITHIAWQYLLNEKFTKEELDDVLQVFHVYYCQKGRQIGKHPSNTTEGRLIFEIRHRQQVVGWQARWLPAAWPPTADEIQACKNNRVQKYLLNPGFSKNAFPYNYDLAINAQTVVAVEGVKKVWKTGPNAIGTFGIQYTLPTSPGVFEREPPIDALWIQKLLYHKKILYILFDRDTEPEAQNTLEWYLTNGGRGKIIKLPEYGPDDLDQYTREEIKRLLVG